MLAAILWAVLAILIIVWVIGFFIARLGDILHILLVVALIILVINLVMLVMGRRSRNL